MGDPKKPKKKFARPRHPWRRQRIEEESAIKEEYGLKNMREIWKMKSFLGRYLDEAKELIAATTEQSKKEEKQMVEKLGKYGFIAQGAGLDNVLSLTLRDILERRLQTQVYKKGFAKSMNQARQFIVHQHITVNGTKISSPSHMVTVAEETQIGFSPSSTLSNAEHPERQINSEAQAKKEKKKQERAEREKFKGRRDQRGGQRGRGQRDFRNHGQRKEAPKQEAKESAKPKSKE